MLTELPDGSFDASNITTVGGYFYDSFNYAGTLSTLPASFKWPALDVTNASKIENFQDAFNTPSSTLSKEVIAIINGSATPNTDRDTFSDNQLGRCFIHDNRLVNPCLLDIELDPSTTTGTHEPVTLTLIAT